MIWKLYTRDTNVSPPAIGFHPYLTREQALDAADWHRGVIRLEVMYIEGPKGERIEPDQIWALLEQRKSESGSQSNEKE